MTEAKNDAAETAKSAAQATPTAATPSVAETDRVAELEAENARLRAQLVEAGQKVEAGKPHEPSFRFSEGQREELERTGRTGSPFTGKLYVGTGVDDAREATPEEFEKAKPPVSTSKPAETAAPRNTGKRK